MTYLYLLLYMVLRTNNIKAITKRKPKYAIQPIPTAIILTGFLLKKG